MWFNRPQKRYCSEVDDNVIGVVTQKGVENYRIDVGGTMAASLPALAFEGATKRNKPNLNVGAVVYCRIAETSKYMEPELSCISTTVKKQWVTGLSLYGELVGGYIFDCSQALAKELLQDNCTVLQCLGAHLPFELAVGVNGKVWVNSTSPTTTILIANAIINSEHMSNSVIEKMVDAIIARQK